MPVPDHPKELSDHLVYFIKPANSDDYSQHLLSIVEAQQIFAREPFGIAHEQIDIPDLLLEQYCVSFSEFSPHALEKLTERRGSYGIGFRKNYVRKNGGHPTWYVEKNSDLEYSFQQIIAEAPFSRNPLNHPIWEIAPFIDVKGDLHDENAAFDWEQEWRMPGPFHFMQEEIAFMVLPEAQHERFREALAEKVDLLFPLIDITWDAQRIRQVLENTKG
jgi:hypothetical protein